jgi:hypothetical protein
MDLFFLKLVATPILILLASLAGRRWGEAIGGWFVGLPLTSGPVAFFLALEQGAGFAAATTRGSLAGVAAEAGFCVAYGTAARFGPWPAALAAGSIAFAFGAAALAAAALPSVPLIALIISALTLSLSLLPRFETGTAALPASPRWDLPARMAVATALVLGFTELAPYVGPEWSGLLATYPVFAAVLAAFAHSQSGPAAAMRVLRGLMIGLFSFTGFFIVLGMALERLGIAVGFIAASAVALVIQGGSLWLMRRPRRLRQ